MFTISIYWLRNNPSPLLKDNDSSPYRISNSHCIGYFSTNIFKIFTPHCLFVDRFPKFSWDFINIFQICLQNYLKNFLKMFAISKICRKNDNIVFLFFQYYVSKFSRNYAFQYFFDFFQYFFKVSLQFFRSLLMILIPNFFFNYPGSSLKFFQNFLKITSCFPNNFPSTSFHFS